MRLPKTLITVSTIIDLMVLLPGCSALNRPYPAKRYFAIELAQRPERAGQPVSATVRVREFRISPPYHQPQFVYKLGESELQRDYYDEFIAPPAKLMTELTIAWLNDSGTFRTTCAGSSAADHDLVLEAVITDLCGDYSKPAAPTAVLAIHFFLLAEQGSRTNVVFDRTYSEHVALGGHELDRLVLGWSQGLQRILASLEADLRAAPGVHLALAR